MEKLLWSLTLFFTTSLAAQELPSVSAADPLAALELGEINDRARAGEIVYLALARGGVAVVDMSASPPKHLATLAEGRGVSRVIVNEGRLHLIVLTEELVSYALTDPAAPVVALTTPLRAPPLQRPAAARDTPPPVDPPARVEAPLVVEPTRGSVVDVRGGRVIFDGAFPVGTHVRVISQRLVSKPGLDDEGVRLVASGEISAVVAIEEQQGGKSMARLGRGDVAQAGDLVESTTEALSERLFLPRRGPYFARVGFHARPFLGLNNENRKPVGALVDLYGSVYLESVPVALNVELAPAGFVLFGADAHYPAALSGVATYYTDWFEIGLGVGGLVGNVGPCFREIDVEGKQGPQRCEENTGFTINQMLRLGPIDGIHATWKSSIFSRPDAFVFGVGRGELGVPLSSQLSLFTAGGAGENGWGFGELGVRSFLGGTGAPGTVVLSASLGVVGIFDGPGEEFEQTFEGPDGELQTFTEYRQEFVVGPSVAFGIEWRL